MRSLARVGALVALVGCAQGPSATARTTANVVAAVGDIGIATLDACAIALERDATAVRRAADARAKGQPEPIVLTAEEQARLVQACDAVGDAYDVIQTTHAAMVATIKLAEEADRLGMPSRWGDVLQLQAEALAATEAARQAIATARVVVGRRL